MGLASGGGVGWAGSPGLAGSGLAACGGAGAAGAPGAGAGGANAGLLDDRDFHGGHAGWDDGVIDVIGFDDHAGGEAGRAARGRRWGRGLTGDRGAEDQGRAVELGGFAVDDRAEDGLDRRPQAADPIRANRHVLDQNVDRLGTVAVADEQLDPGDLAGAELEVADLAWLRGQIVGDQVMEGAPFAADFEADGGPLRGEGDAGRLGRLTWHLGAEGVEHRLLHHHRLGVVAPLVDGPDDLLAVGFHLAEEGGLWGVDVLGGDRQADRRTILAAGLGEFADLQGGRDRAVTAEAEFCGRLPAGLGAAGSEADPEAVVLAGEHLLVAEPLGVEGGLVEHLGAERAEVVARADRAEAEPEDCRTQHRTSPAMDQNLATD